MTVIFEGKIQNRIAIVYGRFQPLTRAHYKMMKKLVDQYQQVFIFPVQALSAYTLKAKTEKGKASERQRKIGRSPLPVGLRADLISKALPSVPKQNIMKLASGSIVVAIDAIKRMHPKVDVNKIDVWCGPDEYDAYVNQLDYIKEPPHSEYDIKVEKFDVGTREEVSGTKLRQALTSPDEINGLSAYKKLVAPPLADKETYSKLRKAMQQLKVPHLESTMPKLLKTIGEGVFKKEKKDKRTYREKLLDDPKHVERWLKHDDENLIAKIVSGGHIEKQTPDESHARTLMKMLENGEKLTKEEIDFLREMGLV